MRRLRTVLAIAATGVAALLLTSMPASAGVTGTEGPSLTGASVTEVAATGATLHAAINSGGTPLTWHLQWSSDLSYAAETTGDDATSASAVLTGLTPGTLYHYRALVGYWHGFVGGADQPVADHQSLTGTFTTLEAATPPIAPPPPVGPPADDPNACHNPVITSAEPIAVMVGERIVLTGSGFGSRGTLRFGAVPATVIESWTPTVIAARVPTGAGPAVTVTCPDGTRSPEFGITIVTASNQSPVAVIDKLGTAARPALDSSGSFDVDGAIVRRLWTSGRKKLSTKITYRPRLKPGGRIKVTLTVWDAAGASDHRTITVKAPKPAVRRPRTTKPVTEKIVVALNAQVLFGFDRSALSSSGRRAVTRLRALARRSTSITIAGFASREGPADYNLALSRDRAQSVRSALMSRLSGGAKVGLRANGEGGSPRVRETGPRSRQLNRKVIVTMTHKVAG